MAGRKCIFCDELLTGNREKEHVIPQWLLDHLGIRDTELYLAVAKSEDDAITESRTHVADGFVEGRVCGGCNSGWMSTMENQTKRILISLIDGHSSLLNITIDERVLVARWAAKTAYVLSHATPLKKATDAAHLRFVMDNLTKLPAGVVVYSLNKPSQPETLATFKETAGQYSRMFPEVARRQKAATKLPLNFVTCCCW